MSGLALKSKIGRVLPNFFVIGAAKSGTSALHEYLGLHPEIHMSQVKETHYFADPNGWFPFGRISNRRDYERQFETGLPLRGESSPSYTLWPLQESVSERIHAAVPEARLIYLVRDPIKRMQALYLQRVAWQQNLGSFEEALGNIEDPLNEYVIGSLYMQQLRRYLSCFDAERILVVDQTDLRADRQATLRRVFMFLEVEDFWSDAFRDDANVTGTKRQYPAPYRRIARSSVARSLVDRLPDSVRSGPMATVKNTISRPLPDAEMTPETRTRCEEFIAPDVRELRTFCNAPFAHWSV